MLAAEQTGAQSSPLSGESNAPLSRHHRVSQKAEKSIVLVITVVPVARHGKPSQVRWHAHPGLRIAYCCHAESPTDRTTAPPSPAAADGKTRLVRSLLLQDGAAEVQPPAPPGPLQPSSSPRVLGEGAPEPKPASPATSLGFDQQLPESMPSPPPMPQAPAKGPATAAQAGPENSEHSHALMQIAGYDDVVLLINALLHARPGGSLD